MNRIIGFLKENSRLIVIILAVLVGLSWLLLNKLASLTDGLSASEISAAHAPVGWHGIYADPLYLALKLVRSVVFFVYADHGQFLTRLPNAFFGGLTILTFGWLIWLWHGPRTALLTTTLFACSAWTLHISRLATPEIMYLWLIPTLLLIQALLSRFGERAIVWYGSIMLWGLLLYIPGAVWLIIASLYMQRSLLAKTWKQSASFKRKILSAFSFMIWLPLLIHGFTNHGVFTEWLGLPQHWDGPLVLLKQLANVPINLFLHGPLDAERWLGRAPILDIFMLTVCGLGIYFYTKNWHSSRSRVMGIMFIIGVVLVGIGGPVGLSLLIPLLYIMAAAGIAYLLHEWLKIFPLNPLARAVGIGLVSLAVASSCAYNLKAYFVAWPHNDHTRIVFRNTLK